MSDWKCPKVSMEERRQLYEQDSSFRKLPHEEK